MAALKLAERAVMAAPVSSPCCTTWSFSEPAFIPRAGKSHYTSAHSRPEHQLDCTTTRKARLRELKEKIPTTCISTACALHDFCLWVDVGGGEEEKSSLSETQHFSTDSLKYQRC